MLLIYLLQAHLVIFALGNEPRRPPGVGLNATRGGGC